MSPSARKAVITAAVAAPILTAVIMGAIIYLKTAPASTPSGTPAPADGDRRSQALARLASASSLAPEEMVKVADEAERDTGGPLAEAWLVRALAARKRFDLEGERVAVDRAMSLGTDLAETQLAKALLAAEVWARAASPKVLVHPPTTTLVPTVGLTSPPALEPGLEKLGGRAAIVVKLLHVLRAGGKPEDIAPLWTELSAVRIEDRLAFAIGIHSLRQGAADEALTWLRMALAAAPQDPPRLRAVAMADLFITESAEAFQVLERWRQADPTSAEAWAWMAVGARGKGDLAKARECLDTAVKMDPAWRCARGWVAYAAKDTETALADSGGTEDPWGLYLRALIRWEKEDVANALADCATVLAKWPDHYESLVLQARALSSLGKAEEAEKSWKAALRVSPGRTEAKVGIAGFFASHGRLEEAIAAYADVPDAAESHWRAARLMLEAGRHADALRWVNMGIHRYPRDPKLRVTLGRILHARLDHFGELSAYEQALQISPGDDEAKKLLDGCLAEMKRD